MVRFKTISYKQAKFFPVPLDAQIPSGTFEHTLSHLIDNELDLSVVVNPLENDASDTPAYNPKILLKLTPFACSRGKPTKNNITDNESAKIKASREAIQGYVRVTTIANTKRYPGQVTLEKWQTLPKNKEYQKNRTALKGFFCNPSADNNKTRRNSMPGKFEIYNDKISPTLK
jgi:hypothetical protein